MSRNTQLYVLKIFASFERAPWQSTIEFLDDRFIVIRFFAVWFQSRPAVAYLSQVFEMMSALVMRFDSLPVALPSECSPNTIFIVTCFFWFEVRAPLMLEG